MLYVCRDSIPLRADLALALLLVWLGTVETHYATSVGMVALPYLVTFAAYRSPRRLRSLTAAGDVSYGMYLYAFPVQQALVASLGTIDPLLLAATAATVTWVVAYASWRLVELPALRRKPRARAARPADEPQARATYLRPAPAPLAL